jgi:hypothetical protein
VRKALWIWENEGDAMLGKARGEEVTETGREDERKGMEVKGRELKGRVTRMNRDDDGRCR